MSDLGSENQNTELVEAQAQIWSHIFNYISFMSLKCAVELEIPDIIHRHGKSITISQLDTALSIPPSKSHCLSRLLRILIHSGFFAKQKINKNGDEEKEEEEGYVLTKSSQLLLKDHPLCAAPYLLTLLNPILIDPFHHASSWLRNESQTTPFQMAHDNLEYCAQDTKLNNLVNESFGRLSSESASVVVNDCKWVFDGLESLVDVGGGNGSLAEAIAQAFPHLDCTVLDLPHVVDGLHGSHNLKFVAGDMFKAVPPAQAILLKLIIILFLSSKILFLSLVVYIISICITIELLCREYIYIILCAQSVYI